MAPSLPTRKMERESDSLQLEAAERDYEEDLLREQIIKVESYLVNEKTEIDRMKQQIDSMPKRIEETLDAYLKRMQEMAPQQPQPIGGGLPGGNIISALPDLLKIFGIGGPSNVNTELLMDLSNQFNAMTAFMWKQKLRQMREEAGLPEHLPIEGMHLT